MLVTLRTNTLSTFNSKLQSLICIFFEYIYVDLPNTSTLYLTYDWHILQYEYCILVYFHIIHYALKPTSDLSNVHRQTHSELIIDRTFISGGLANLIVLVPGRLSCHPDLLSSQLPMIYYIFCSVCWTASIRYKDIFIYTLHCISAFQF